MEVEREESGEGMHPKTPMGKKAKGKRTRKKKKYKQFINY